MNIRILDVLGPLMVGPSSSHTAGALKLARTAALIAGKPFHEVHFGLYGSFAQTGLGHGTDRALVAGVLGFSATDERIRDSFRYAEEFGLRFSFGDADLPDSHENSCVLTFRHDDGTTTEIVGSSIGGGRIEILSIDGVRTDITAECPTILVRQHDRKGVISSITSLLAESGINIGVMRLSREFKGDVATTVIETDDTVSEALIGRLAALPNVMDVRFVNV